MHTYWYTKLHQGAFSIIVVVIVVAGCVNSTRGNGGVVTTTDIHPLAEAATSTVMPLPLIFVLVIALRPFGLEETFFFTLT